MVASPVTLELPPTPFASAVARCRIGDACLAWGVPEVLLPVRAVVSELVDNAARHAGTRIRVTAVLDAGCVTVRVRDGSCAVPMMVPVHAASPAAPLDLRGAGLRLVERHAAGWGVTPHPDGKTVWASVRVPGRRPERRAAPLEGRARPRLSRR